MASPFFPTATLYKMKNLGLSEADVLDVFNHGESSSTSTGSKMVVKKYSSLGYEVGLLYITDNWTGKYVITHVWKRERR